MSRRSANSKFDLPYDYKTVTLHGETVTVRVYHKSYKNRVKPRMTASSGRPKAPPMTLGQMKQGGFCK